MNAHLTDELAQSLVDGLLPERLREACQLYTQKMLDDVIDKAKDMLGGDRSAEDMKTDAEEVKDTAMSDQSMTDKAKEGYGEVKDPGAPG